ncbi:thioredoxin domain-containing protein [Clostridium sp. LIBA-8841]|uniref:thioredoxin domain-containing protein n=1 Tax=Clostridium sp. LIBA-8841 TaxID=2987530 RepID=UPI002AC3B87B|nr:conjugal transfer protein TraF [Clostridium sp. LIBA-8841]MDZ5254059.1 thioredoxin domain-containing protein [Clostridium sp. LIBA-8841]
MFEKNAYEEDIKSFEKILSTQADKLLSTEDLAVVYIGRSTCPYCRKFAKKLSGLANKINTTIYYVSSDNFSDNELSSFREKYNIVTVPGFIVNKNGEITVRCDSSTPEEEILDMLK